MKKIIASFIILAISLAACDDFQRAKPTANSGVQQVKTEVQTQLNGHTIEQDNVINRYKMDNKPGSIKHLYIISSYSGQVLIYSTVKGKVTSSGKRISPPAQVRNTTYSEEYFPDLIQDDGTYGSSSEYIYWWDSKGVYHQHYPSGGQIIHISDQPLAVKSVILNMEVQ